MNFFAPAALIFAIVLPVIVLFYLLKQKKQEKVISSTMLWQQVLADTISQTPWQKLRRNLLLFLQLLLALLLVLALTRPYLQRIQEGGNNYILLLDTSASMAVVEAGGKSRLDLAKAELERLVAAQKKGTKFTVIKVGTVPEVLVNQSRNPQEIFSQLKKVKPGLYQANLETSLSLVTAMIEKGTKAQVIFYSDGGVDAPEGPVGLTDFLYRRVGTRDDNVAIGAFAVREGEAGPLALTRIDNYGPKSSTVSVQLWGQDRLLDVQSVTVGPGKPEYLFWPIKDNAPYYEARIVEADALAADNRAWLVPPRTQQNKVLLVSRGNLFLEQALKLNPGLDVRKAAPEDFKEIRDKYDLYVFDAFWPDQPPRGCVLLFNPPPASGLAGPDDIGLKDTTLKPADNAVMHNVSWNDVHIAKSKPLKDNGGWQAVLTADGKTVAALGRIGDYKSVVFGFDLHQSDLPLRPGFPILIQNLTAWLVPQGSFRESQVQVGTPVELNLHPETSEAKLFMPGGEKSALSAAYQGRLTDTMQSGLYRLEQNVSGAKLTEYLAVNFFSPAESQVKPAAQVKLGKKDIKTADNKQVDWEIWPLLALAALLLLSVEWWVYLRGH